MPGYVKHVGGSGLSRRMASSGNRKRMIGDPSKTERAARQQGSSFLRENSSNGGKTIRTFWLHTRDKEGQCQEEIIE